MKTLGERLRLVRGDVSRDKYAPLLGVSLTTVANYENDLRSPDANFITKVLALHPTLNPTWLITGDGPRERIDENIQQRVDIYGEKEIPSCKNIDTREPFDALGMVEGMGLLTKIYSSGDNVYIRAINANLMAFSDAVENKAKVVTMAESIQFLEAQMNDKFNELKIEMARLRNENNELRRALNTRGGDEPMAATG